MEFTLLNLLAYLWQVQPANFTLVAVLCPGGYILNFTQTDITVCVCNTDVSEVLICEDSQETVVIKVERLRERERKGK